MRIAVDRDQQLKCVSQEHKLLKEKVSRLEEEVVQLEPRKLRLSYVQRHAASHVN